MSIWLTATYYVASSHCQFLYLHMSSFGASCEYSSYCFWLVDISEVFIVQEIQFLLVCIMVMDAFDESGFQILHMHGLDKLVLWWLLCFWRKHMCFFVDDLVTCESCLLWALIFHLWLAHVCQVALSCLAEQRARIQLPLIYIRAKLLAVFTLCSPW